MVTDLRHALRTLGHAPAFTLVVILTLGLGIGPNTAIFSLIDQLLLRLLPVSNPEELVQLDGPGPFNGRTMNDQTFSYPMYQDFRDRNDVLSGTIARAGFDATLVEQGQAERVNVELVSGNFFEVLGVRPVLGRAIAPDDDRVRAGHPVVVLSHRYWMRRFAGNPQVLNSSLTINTTQMTVIGVAPPTFSGVLAVNAPDLFVPLMMKAQITPTWDDLDNRRSRWVTVIGRLKPGVSIETARAQLDVTYKQINAEELESIPAFVAASQTFKDRFRAKALAVEAAGKGLSGLRRGFSTPIAVLMGMVGLVLLIACANVASLLVARAAARQKEIGLRLALGASRARIVRQTLFESTLLSLAGGLVGLVLSVWVSELLIGLLPADASGTTLSATPDLRVGLFTLGVSLVTAVVFGLAPALQTSKPDMNRTLREQAGSVSSGASHARLRKGLVVVQVALSMLLVAGAGLFARSLFNLKHLSPGFDTGALVSFAISPELNGYDQPRLKQLYQSLQEDLGQVTGARGASMAAEPVLSDSVSSRTVQVQGYQTKPDENMNPWTNEVAPDYFRTMGIPLVLGREFTDRDGADAPLVGIVNETFAKYYFGSENPIGRRFGWRVLNDAGAIEIVGVVKDSLHGTMREGSSKDNEVRRFVYTPLQQSTELTGMTMYVRAEPGREPDLIQRVRDAVRKRDAGLPVYNVTTMDRTIDEAVFTERMLAVLSAAFGLLATLLAAVGLYGLMSYTVARRTREIGIRIALGAERRTVVWLVLREVVVLVAIGLAIGVPAALGLSRLVSSQLFGLSARDPLTLMLAVAVLAIVGAAAGYLPARRAASVEPVRALRYE
jgi:putative ABC transport system permease protein